MKWTSLYINNLWTTFINKANQHTNMWFTFIRSIQNLTDNNIYRPGMQTGINTNHNIYNSLAIETDEFWTAT